MDKTKNLSRIFILIVAPFIALGAIGGLVNGCLYVSANEYFGQDLYHLAVQFIRTQVNRDLLFASLSSLVLFAITAVLVKYDRFRIFVLPYLFAFQLCVLISRLLFSTEWSMTMARFSSKTFPFGLPLPKLGREMVIWMLIAITLSFILITVIILFRKVLERYAMREWLSNKLVKCCFVFFFIAFSVALIVNLTVWFVPPVKPTRPFNIIIITWDSVRADHISSYGYPRQTSPHLDKFAQEAVLFETAISQHNWTRPSYASMLTGIHKWSPSTHLNLSQITLAEALKNKGYRTFGYVQNPNLCSDFHFNQGFDSYFQIHDNKTPMFVNHYVIKKINKISQTKEPFFLFIHYQEPHWPYRFDNRFLNEFLSSTNSLLKPAQIDKIMVSHGKGWNQNAPDALLKIQQILDLYDASIRYSDEALGEILDTLKKNNIWENSLIIFNSDHGDEFGDHGQFSHAHLNLHPELTYVPFIVRFPNELGVGPQRISTPVQMLDIFPTVLSALGTSPPNYMSGLNLLPLSELESRERFIFSSRDWPRPYVSIRNRRHSLIADYGESLFKFFDLLVDPGEQFPLSDFQDNPTFIQMKMQTDNWYNTIRKRDYTNQSDDKWKKNKELKQRLKALGYIQ